MLTHWSRAAVCAVPVTAACALGCGGLDSSTGDEEHQDNATLAVDRGVLELTAEAPINGLDVQVLDHAGPDPQPGWEFSGVDLNLGAKGKFIYVGWTRGADHPVTSLNFAAYNDAQRDPPPGWTFNPRDLNQGSGGKFIYMLWRHDEPGVSAITSITFVATDAGRPPDLGGGYISIPQDLNEGAGGKFIWAYYRR